MYFTEFDNIVARLSGGLADAAECHGHLLGLLGTHTESAVTLWLETLAAMAPSDDALVAEARRELEEIGNQYAAQLATGDLSFELLVPDDEEDLITRTTALAHWCQGFLFGIAQGGVKSFAGLPGECAEILDDFSVLTQATADDVNEDAERAFFEIFEFVRVGTQLIYEELGAAHRTADTVSH